MRSWTLTFSGPVFLIGGHVWNDIKKSKSWFICIYFVYKENIVGWKPRVKTMFDFSDKTKKK